jgi:hypothetical protein
MVRAGKYWEKEKKSMNMPAIASTNKRKVQTTKINSNKTIKQ